MTKRWVVYAKVGVFWDGPTYTLGKYRWLFLAKIHANYYKWKHPLRWVYAKREVVND